AEVHVPIRMHDDGVHLEVRAGIEAGVYGAIGVEATDVRPRRAPGSTAQARESADDDELAVGLQPDVREVAAVVDAGIERVVNRSAQFRPPERVARVRSVAAAPEHGKETADEELAVGLLCQAEHD